MRSYSCCSSSNKKSLQVQSLSSILKIVAAESRLKLLCILKQGEHCVCELVDHDNLSQSLISHHLKDLKNAGLILSRKDGLRVYYSLTPKGLHITNLLFQI